MKIEDHELAGLNFDWLKNPIDLNSPVISQSAPAPAPAPAPASAGWLQTFADTAKQIAPSLAATYASIKMQKQLAKLNQQRAAAGQPPLDTAQYMEASAPVIKIQGGVDSGTGNTMKYIGIAGAAALALILLTRKGDGRK